MQLEKILVLLSKELKEKGVDQSIALVGSAVENYKYNDIDFLMIVDDINNVKSKILSCMCEYVISICDDAIKINNYKGNKISIALYSKNKVNDIIDDFISGILCNPTHRTWCLGYWMPESFVENLRKMKIINDPTNYMNNIKNKLNKEHIYAKKAIIKECLEEIKIKYNYLSKSNVESLEYTLYKNDIILCIIRGLKILNNEFLVSFKKIKQEIEILNNEDLNNIVNDNLNNMSNIINLFEKYLYSNSLYLGTWQFSGDFKQLTEDEIILLIKYAKEKGIKRFDTALVYGKGKVEKILGKVLELDDIVLTKIPAKEKPKKGNPTVLDNYYDYKYILKCVKESCDNLNREYIDICLLHNWILDWNNETKLIEYLLELKKLDW